MFTKTIPSFDTPRVLAVQDNFVTAQIASDFLGISELEVARIAENGHLQTSFNGPQVMYKREDLEVVARNLGPSLPPERKQPKENTADVVQFFAWITCGIVATVSVFSKRLYLLEFAVPVIALVGFIAFGIAIWNNHKIKQQEKARKKMQEETDSVLAQAERLERLNSMMK